MVTARTCLRWFSLAGSLFMALWLLSACTVDFNVDQANTFTCSSDEQCEGGLKCIFVTDEDGEQSALGVCGRPVAVDAPLDCIDNDGDGYGEGTECPKSGGDCNDNDSTVYPGALEICDGKDNDCDCADIPGECGLEMIDEATTCEVDDDCIELNDASRFVTSGMRCVNGACMYRCQFDQLGVCATAGPDGGGAVESCRTTLNENTGEITGGIPPCIGSGAYGDTYQPVSPQEEACDGFDNNCNGQVDENPDCDTCGRSCSPDLGECTAGIIMCDENSVPTGCINPDTNLPAVSPSDDVCDGKDNNCDGIVDNSIERPGVPSSQCDDGCPFGMVLIRNNNESFCIDRFEASRPDATATNAGVDNTRAVSRPGVLPWTNLGLAQARDACNGVGLIDGVQYPSKRLCTDDELAFACGGVNMDQFSYGANYSAAICNGADAGVGGIVPTGPTAEVPRDFNACTADRGGAIVYDLLGNVAEFSLDNLQGKIYGGSFNSPEAELTCQSAVDGATAREDVGFRCCYDP